MHLAMHLALVLLLLLVTIPFGWITPLKHAHIQPSAPKLLVLVVFDQMRGDYLERWKPLYGANGFNRLVSQGAWYPHCHYPYSMTVTGAGHATLGTGCVPAQHGIVENDWYDRNQGKSVYCATFGDRFKMIPEGAKSKSGKGSGGSPVRLLEPTVGDVVKQLTQDKGKVIGISLKDRGGVLPAGMKADICYWYDDSLGGFVTSDFYTGKLPDYMIKFNSLKWADQWFGKDWSRIREDINYSEYSSPDDVIGEGTGTKQGRTFPHPMTGGESQVGSKFYDAVYSSPMGNDLTWLATQTILEAEQLGQRDQTDFLVVSYSSNDAVGHIWGPDSQEVLDITLRSDKIIAEMIDYLDSRIGRDRYLLALSADHGVCPLPDILHSKGIETGRIDPAKEMLTLELHLNELFHTNSKWVEAISGAGIYLNHRTIKATGKTTQDVEKVTAEWFMSRPYVMETYTRTQLLETSELPGYGNLVKQCFHPDRSGDVMPVFKPYYFMSKYTTGTTHGSPHDYDTHVPLVFFGANIRSGIHNERVSPQLAAVALAHSMGGQLKNSKVKVPADLFK